MRVLLAAALTAILVPQVALGGEEELELTASVAQMRVVPAGTERLRLEVRLRCSSPCSVRTTATVSVRRGDREFELRARPVTRALPAASARNARLQLARRPTHRLQQALDRRGTVAAVAFDVGATSPEAGMATANADQTLAPGFAVLSRRVAPRSAYFDGPRTPQMMLSFRSARRENLRVELRRGGSSKAVRTWRLGEVRPFEPARVRWDGLERDGDVADDGNYRFGVGRAGGAIRRAGSFAFHGHVFPVRARHGTGPIGHFGAPRAGGRRHEGYDIHASCGTRLEAARGGVVERRGFDPELYGNYVQVDARRSRQDYFYAHMRRPARVDLGERVRTGTKLGEVGQTGNARSTPCHLHFEIRIARRPIDPWPSLKRWDRYS